MCICWYTLYMKLISCHISFFLYFDLLDKVLNISLLKSIKYTNLSLYGYDEHYVMLAMCNPTSKQ